MNIMNQLFEQWDQKGIRYVHFKSNGNLARNYAGNSDFDVLVDPKRTEDVITTLLQAGAKQARTITEKQYPGVDNWLLYDEKNGNIQHLHLHYQIMSGKPYVKDYEIPWRDIAFDTRVFNKQYQIYTTNSELELIILSVRLVIKSRWSDMMRSMVGFYRTNSHLQEEREGLLKIISPEKIEVLLHGLFSAEDTGLLQRIILSPVISSSDFRKLFRIIRRSFRESRRMTAFRASILSLKRTIHYHWLRIKKKAGYYTVSKKTSGTNGLILAFVGVDGSGKSTVAKEIYKWLSRQFDCTRVYMGLGDGKTTWFASVLKKARRMAGRGYDEREQSINSRNYVKKDPVSFWKKPSYYIRKKMLIRTIYSIEKNNRKKLINLNRYRINGGIGILDRYPQTELPNQNDGPKVGAYKERIRAKRFIEKKEKKEKEALSVVYRIKPDAIFRLNISAEESMRRKPEQHDISVLKKKIEDLNSISFQNAKIINVDAAQAYDEEIKEIKRVIWQML